MSEKDNDVLLKVLTRPRSPNQSERLFSDARKQPQPEVSGRVCAARQTSTLNNMCDRQSHRPASLPPIACDQAHEKWYHNDNEKQLRQQDSRTTRSTRCVLFAFSKFLLLGETFEVDTLSSYCLFFATTILAQKHCDLNSRVTFLHSIDCEDSGKRSQKCGPLWLVMTRLAAGRRRLSRFIWAMLINIDRRRLVFCSERFQPIEGATDPIRWTHSLPTKENEAIAYVFCQRCR